MNIEPVLRLKFRQLLQRLLRIAIEVESVPAALVRVDLPHVGRPLKLDGVAIDPRVVLVNVLSALGRIVLLQRGPTDSVGFCIVIHPVVVASTVSYEVSEGVLHLASV